MRSPELPSPASSNTTPDDILLVSQSDRVGGAAQDGWNLYNAYKALGLNAWIAAKIRTVDDPDVFAIHPDRAIMFKGKPTPGERGLKGLDRISALLDRALGREDFHHPTSRRILDLPPRRPRLVHCHNLHEGYFDLRFLPELSAMVPTNLTLHDTWLLAGNCGYFRDCERWLTGCGLCPDISLYPGLRRDGTAANWRRKKEIFARSRVWLTTPCQWLMDQVAPSILAPALVDARVIPYGIDLDLHSPGDRTAARRELGLDPDAVVILFSAQNMQGNPWKDYSTFRRAVEEVGRMDLERTVVFLALGSEGEQESVGNARMVHSPFTRDRNRVVAHYRAADLYAHAARADTFPYVVLEALACGLPVAATAVGGIPEQVRDLDAHGPDAATGLLTAPGDGHDLARAMAVLARDPELCQRLGKNARADAEARFHRDRERDDMLDWYQTMLNRWPRLQRNKDRT